MRYSHRLLIGSVLSGCCATAHAQSGDVPIPQSAEAVTSETADALRSLGTVTVTAQRRDENLSETPVAVYVISDEKLAEGDITTANDLRTATPGLSVRSSTTSEQLNFALRGNTQDPFSDVRPGVLPYFNEVQIGAPLSSGSLYDLQSVQVLKGPQGTLFGRSATGGALLFTSTKPGDALGGYASILGGDYDRVRLEGAVDLPIAKDGALFRLAGFYDSREGFQHNVYNGQTEGDQEKFGIRPSLSLQFGTSVTNDLVVDYYKSDSENTLPSISGLLPFTGMPPPYVPAAFLYAGIDTPVDRATGIGTVQAFLAAQGAPPAALDAVPAFYDAYFSAPGRPSGGLGAVLAAATDPFRVSSDAENYADTDSTTVTNTTEFELTPNVSLKNIFGYIDNSSDVSFDADGTPFALSQQFGDGLSTDYKGLTEELQLVGSALDGQLDFVIGGYYSDEEKSVVQNSQLFDILLGGLLQVNDTTLKSKTNALYAQGTYFFGDSGFGATLGLRYTDEEVRAILNPNDIYRQALGDPAPPGLSYDQERTDDNLSWTIGGQYQASPSWLFYVASRRAYRSAGFNTLAAPIIGPASIGGNTYDAEQVTDLEFGTKFNGYLGQAPARLNIALYQNWIEDSQRAAFGFVNGGAAALTVNAPEAEVRGIEIDGQIQPLEDLTLGGVFNYTDAEFKDGDVFVAGVPSTFDQVPDTPEQSGLGFAQFEFPVSANLTGMVYGDAYFQSDTTTTPNGANSVGTSIDSYTLVNLRAGLENREAGWSLIANVKNVFDETYYVGGLHVGEIYQVNTLVPGEPRTFTLQLRLSF